MMSFPHLSAGLAADGDGVRYVYGEIAYWNYITAGLGFGYEIQNASIKPALPSGGAAHVFLGFPFPLFGYSPHGETGPIKTGVYVEPYYRPRFIFSGEIINEAGVMLKLGFSTEAKYWKL